MKCSSDQNQDLEWGKQTLQPLTLQEPLHWGGSCFVLLNSLGSLCHHHENPKLLARASVMSCCSLHDQVYILLHLWLWIAVSFLDPSVRGRLLGCAILGFSLWARAAVTWMRWGNQLSLQPFRQLSLSLGSSKISKLTMSKMFHPFPQQKLDGTWLGDPLALELEVTWEVTTSITVGKRIHQGHRQNRSVSPSGWNWNSGRSRHRLPSLSGMTMAWPWHDYGIVHYQTYLTVVETWNMLKPTSLEGTLCFGCVLIGAQM